MSTHGRQLVKMLPFVGALCNMSFVGALCNISPYTTALFNFINYRSFVCLQLVKCQLLPG